MSCQPTPHPQASGTAASTASSGTATNTPTRTREPMLSDSGSRSGRAPLGAGVDGVSTAARAPAASAEVVTAVLPRRWRLRPDDERSAHNRGLGRCTYAYVTVTYGPVG